MFCILTVVILGSALTCVMTKSIMRAATFLLFVLFGVAGIYFLLDYTFLGAAQIAVYAGGITMMYVFAIQLVSKRTLQSLVERFKGSRLLSGALLSIVGLVVVGGVLLKSQLVDAAADLTTSKELPMKTVGESLLGADKYGYILPFEFISIFILACIVGGILIAKKEEKQ